MTNLFFQNKQRQNCIHLICLRALTPRIRTDMLRFTLEAGLYGMDLEHVLEERDEEGNTALHLAAACGLKDCVEVGCGLVSFPGHVVSVWE